MGDANESSVSFSAPRQKTGSKGRPVVQISRNQLDFLVEKNFTATQIASIMDCSTKVIYRRLKKEGLLRKDRFTDISEEELDEKLNEIKRSFPNAGYTMIAGHLASQGVFLQRERIRAAVRRVDAEGIRRRSRNTIKRRSYKVPTPNSVWHIDAHMKLVRWGFVTHGCIDGYSRLIPYVRCATNNMAKTVLDFFVDASVKYGLPSKVRSDKGGENVMVALFMNLMRGPETNSHITGRSVHNSRIERLWRDIFVQVISRFHSLFSSFEEDEDIRMDPDDAIERTALHFLYFDDINTALESFRKAWNDHKVSTESNRTPHQIWLEGMLENINARSEAVQGVFGTPAATSNTNLQSRLSHFGLTLEDLGGEEEVQTSVTSVLVPGPNTILINDNLKSEMNGAITRMGTDKEKFWYVRGKLVANFN